MWCRKEPVSLDFMQFAEGAKPTKKRCPECNRLLFVKWLTGDEDGYLHAYLPAHKIPKAKLTKKAGQAARKKSPANKNNRGRMFR